MIYWKFNFNLICSKIRQIIDTKHLIKLITLAVPILSLLTAHRCVCHLPDPVRCPGLSKAHQDVRPMLCEEPHELPHRSAIYNQMLLYYGKFSKLPCLSYLL